MQTSSAYQPAVVIGAGAAGLMAAIFAARGPRPVLLLEGTPQPGRKILISGGGRCNVLPVRAAPADFISDASLHLVRKILAAWPLAGVRRFFEVDLGVPLREEPGTGKLFPTANRALAVLDALLAAAHERHVSLRTTARVMGLQRSAEGWQVQLASGEAILAGSVVLATGGLSAPATGSDGAGLGIARHLGHSIVPTYPALVPLTSAEPAHRALAGISLPVRLSAPVPESVRSRRNGRPRRDRSLFHVRGGFLFTHRGYSGPAVLNISHVAVRAMQEGAPQPPIFVQWTSLGREDWDALLRANSSPLGSLLREHLPERLAAQLLAEARLPGAEMSQLRREERQRLVETFTRYPLPYDGHEGYRVAEVTGGGIPLSEVNPATLESRLAPGLYFCGEMLDAFGPIGGFNFLWSWVTGRIAGLSCNRGEAH